MSDAAPPTSRPPSPPPSALDGRPPAWLVPAVGGGLGLLLGLLLGFFLGSASGASSTRSEADARIAKIQGSSEAKAAKDTADREAAQALAQDLGAKVEVGRAVEFALEALNEIQ